MHPGLLKAETVNQGHSIMGIEHATPAHQLPGSE